MNDDVFDLRKGQVWQTRVKLSMSSLSKYSSLISILRGWGCAPGVAGGLIGIVPNMSVGAKKCEKKSRSSSHYLHCSFRGKIEMSTERPFKWNTK